MEFAEELPETERTSCSRHSSPSQKGSPPRDRRLRLSEHNRRWWTLAAMSFALFMVMLDNTAVNVALPSIQRDFDASLSALEWTVNAYTLAFAVLLVTGGRLGRHLRPPQDVPVRRRRLRARVGDDRLRAHRGLARRIAGGPGHRRGVDDARHALDHLQRVPARGARQGDRHVGRHDGDRARAGALVGGWLTEDVSWRAIFFLNLPVAVGAVVVTLFAAHESRDETVGRARRHPRHRRITVGLTALVFALVEGNSGAGARRRSSRCSYSAWSPRRVRRDRGRSPAPVVDFASFRSKPFVGANIVAFMVSFGMLAMFFFLALYMQNILGYSPLQAGVRFLPRTVMIIVAGPITGRLADRFGPRPLMVAGMLIVDVSCSGSRASRSAELRVPGPAFMLMGLGMGLVMSPMSMAAMNAVDRSKAGVASGHALDVPHGRRHVRRRRPRRADRHRRPLGPQAVPPAGAGGRRARARRGLGCGAGLKGAPAQVVHAAE